MDSQMEEALTISTSFLDHYVDCKIPGRFLEVDETVTLTRGRRRIVLLEISLQDKP